MGVDPETVKHDIRDVKAEPLRLSNYLRLENNDFVGTLPGVGA